MPLAILRRVESDPAFEGAGERQAIGEAEELGDDVELVLRGLQQETVESIAREVGFSRAFKRWIGSSARADTDNNGVDDLLDFALGSRGAPTAASDGVGGFTVTLERDASAQASLTLERAAGLVPATWQPPNATLLSRAPVSGTVERLTLAVPAPPGVTRFYVRGKVGD